MMMMLTKECVLSSSRSSALVLVCWCGSLMVQFSVVAVIEGTKAVRGVARRRLRFLQIGGVAAHRGLRRLGLHRLLLREVLILGLGVVLALGLVHLAVDDLLGALALVTALLVVVAVVVVVAITALVVVATLVTSVIATTATLAATTPTVLLLLVASVRILGFFVGLSIGILF